MTAKIIGVTPTENLFSISWTLGSRCNYDYMYCPSELHDKHSKFLNLESLQTAWSNVYDASKEKKLKYKISFSGGEVTANKNFLPFVKWLKANYDDIARIDVTSNGSASLRYYQQLASLIESLSFSVHSEFFNEKEFFTKVQNLNNIMIRPGKSFHVNVMNEYWNQDRISLYKEFLDLQNISYSINEINYDVKVRDNIVSHGVKNFEQFYQPIKLQLHNSHR